MARKIATVVRRIVAFLTLLAAGGVSLLALYVSSHALAIVALLTAFGLVGVAAWLAEPEAPNGERPAGRRGRTEGEGR